MNEPLKDELIDLETGEILEPNRSVVVKDLPRYARALRAIENRIAMIEKYQNEEVERVKALCAVKIDAYRNTHSFIMGRTNMLMRDTGEERLEYPGLGVLRFGWTRESVNDETWTDNFDDDMRDITRKQQPSLFVTKTITRPDKKAIMVELKKGREVPGFTINEKRETFVFKAEK